VTAPTRWHFEAADAATRLREASDELDAILSARGVSERACYAARLVAEEVVLNALEHGGARFVAMEMDPVGDPHRLVFEDDGVPFDPTTQADSRGSDAPGDVPPRGRGLILVHGFTRAIEHRLADGCNRLSVLLVE
jgi:anti-sigma regulatory factor (Ser/Thr protein kinase)